jgi:hypothetical protein
MPQVPPTDVVIVTSEPVLAHLLERDVAPTMAL